ncbi:hypothetical protein CWB99_12330 [Pseudoalteromonas rubra]|uniref:Lipoprotein n=1 Tax=Pseudoalteromonas rubra TaxID=43658 RepID=A0A5S3WKP9_9GAMM|nr:hypothetical protein [Pseudoalteromonas rubra]TMP28191.1 hypothetical protein CWB99_12330 [Pseudoalteromonas rubra]TMP34893.1 hypothetical protein CWC00_05960 [Pseudoalteromonas rubra]
MKFKILAVLLMLGAVTACQTTLHPDNRTSISNIIIEEPSDKTSQDSEVRLSNVAVGKYDRKGGKFALSLKSSSYIVGNYQITPHWVIEPANLDTFKELLSNYLKPEEEKEFTLTVDLGSAGNVLVLQGEERLYLNNFLKGSFVFTKETVAELYQFINKPYVLPEKAK